MVGEGTQRRANSSLVTPPRGLLRLDKELLRLTSNYFGLLPTIFSQPSGRHEYTAEWQAKSNYFGLTCITYRSQNYR